MRVRQSMVKAWSTCGLQAKFKYLDRLPDPSGSKAVFGTCIHAALDHWNRTTNVDEAVKLFCELWDNPSQVGLEVAIWNRYTTYGGLRLKGIEILRAMHEAQRWEKRTVIASEHQFLVPFGKHELTGTVDLLELKRNGKGVDILRVCDYKTASRKPYVAALATDIQFSAYIYASLQPEFWLGNGPDFPPMINGEWWWETLKDAPRRGIWIALWSQGAELDAGARDDMDFARLYRICNEIERAIDFEVFVPSLGEHCGYCSYANGPCPTKVPTQAEWDKERLESPSSWL